MRLSAVVLAVALSLAPAGAADKPVSDDRISDQVRLKIAGDQDVGSRSIDIEVHDGHVTLKGKVRTEKQRSKAEKLAKKVKGVSSVANELVVGEP
jgi:osmotically-inducible protein OsmY